MIDIACDYAGHTCTSLIRAGPEQLALSRYGTGQYGTVFELLKIMKPQCNCTLSGINNTLIIALLNTEISKKIP
ncbi:hypothetical protein C0J52_02124 [Blattella germanica]|nr:hypothetical protein C0J52_02124 [Blattella germanica]